MLVKLSWEGLCAVLGRQAVRKDGDTISIRLFFKWLGAGHKSKKPNHLAGLSAAIYSGSPTWARTRDLRINSPALYRLSYRGTEERIIGVECPCVKRL